MKKVLCLQKSSLFATKSPKEEKMVDSSPTQEIIPKTWSSLVPNNNKGIRDNKEGLYSLLIEALKQDALWNDTEASLNYSD